MDNNNSEKTEQNQLREDFGNIFKFTGCAEQTDNYIVSCNEILKKNRNSLVMGRNAIDLEKLQELLICIREKEMQAEQICSRIKQNTGKPLFATLKKYPKTKRDQKHSSLRFSNDENTIQHAILRDQLNKEFNLTNSFEKKDRNYINEDIEEWKRRVASYLKQLSNSGTWVEECIIWIERHSGIPVTIVERTFLRLLLEILPILINQSGLKSVFCEPSKGAVIGDKEDFSLKLNHEAIIEPVLISAARVEVDKTEPALPEFQAEFIKVVEFHPHGLQFENEVEFTINYCDNDLQGMDPSLLKVFTWEENAWGAAKTEINLKERTVSSKIKHFSMVAAGFSFFDLKKGVQIGQWGKNLPFWRTACPGTNIEFTCPNTNCNSLIGENNTHGSVIVPKHFGQTNVHLIKEVCPVCSNTLDFDHIGRIILTNCEWHYRGKRKEAPSDLEETEPRELGKFPFWFVDSKNDVNWIGLDIYTKSLPSIAAETKADPSFPDPSLGPSPGPSPSPSLKSSNCTIL